MESEYISLQEVAPQFIGKLVSPPMASQIIVFNSALKTILLG